MQPIIQTHRQKRYSTNAIVAKFERARIRLPDFVFLFVEANIAGGIYKSACRTAMPEKEFYILMCDGKSGVIDSYRYIVEKHGNSHCALFFIDRDLDEFLGKTHHQDEAIYITDGYSIENSYVNREAFKIVLSEILCADIDPMEIEELSNRFQRLRDSFCEQLTPLMALAVWIKRLGGFARLDNVNLTDIFSVTFEGVERRPQALATFNGQISPNIYIINRFFLRSTIRELLHIDKENWPAANIYYGCSGST